MIEREPKGGWLVLLGGGEFSFGETEEADRAWVARAPEGAVGFVPAASGSEDYPKHFAEYLGGVFDREVVTLPIYRARDAKRGKNLERIDEMGVIYLGGGVVDHFLDTLFATPAAERLAAKLAAGGMVVAMGGSAQGLGSSARSIFRGAVVPGLGWLPGTLLEANFDPAHDRRLRTAMEGSEGLRGIGLPAESALLLGPEGELIVVGEVYLFDSATGVPTILEP